MCLLAPPLPGSSRPLILAGWLQVGEAQEDLLQRDLAHRIVVHSVLLFGLLQDTKDLWEAKSCCSQAEGPASWLVWESSGHKGWYGPQDPTPAQSSP